MASHPPNYFQAIVLDINMPIMDGYEACDRINEYLHTSPDGSSEEFRPHIYALTADESEQTSAEIAAFPFHKQFSDLSEKVIKFMVKEIKK